MNGFELALAYNTYDGRRASRFGIHWSDSFDRWIDNGVANRSDGKSYRFTPSNGIWVPGANINDKLTELADSSGRRTGWQLNIAAGDELETYDASGKLLSIRSRIGLTQTLAYSDGTSGPDGGVALDANGEPTTTPLPAGLLIRARDDFGRTLAFGYDESSRVVLLLDPAGGSYQFAYDANNNLLSVGFPDGKVRSYIYNEPGNTGGVTFTSVLTGVTDENGNRFSTFQYDQEQRIVTAELAAGADRHAFFYGTDGSTSVTDPLGANRTYAFQFTLLASKNTGIAGPACPACGPPAQIFDANNNVASRTDWNGNVTRYIYDLARNLETSRVEAFGTPQARTISTQWHPTLRLPAKVSEPLRITSYVYDGDGGVSCGSSGVVCSKTIQATTDTTGAAGFNATSAGTPRSWTYTYNSNGSVLTVNGPRTDANDVTTTSYYSNTDPDFGKRGNVATIANALGHVTSITGYNAHGQPLTIVDPNGMVTTLAYDARQRLKSRNVGGELTSYDYDNAGQLKKVTLPDGSFLAYTYDAAHRLTGMSDSLGNSIAYTLDAMGNRTLQQVFDPIGTLTQTRSRVFNNLNRLFQEFGATGQTTQYAYDDQGNTTSITDPLNHLTTSQYDALNRLALVTDPNLGLTRYAYNGNDQLVSVTDPRNLTTSYDYDGLSNLTSLTSPDTGTTANTYDAAGNLLRKADAKGQITTYAYDPLNRVTLVSFSDQSTQTYTYDDQPNAKGRLTSITERDWDEVVTSVTAYAYDLHGRVITETRTIFGVQYPLSYTYDPFGRLSGLAYPSGRTVSYLFDAIGRVNQVSSTAPRGENAEVIASDIRYQPFGGVRSFKFGNGQMYTRSFDGDGRIANYSLGTRTFAVGYDAASRVSMIADTVDAANFNSYTYDDLDRLIRAQVPGVTFLYSYDAVGNRTSKAVGSAKDTYLYSGTSNRISSITSLAGAVLDFAFDANGSTTSDGINTYAYDARGRMVQSSGALGETSYQINALGQRIRKTNATDDRVFVYDTWGHLIAETDSAGGLKREYLYLNDIPLAVMQ